MWHSSLLLHGGVHSVHIAEAMSGPILLQSIPDELPETRSVSSLSQTVAFAHREGEGAFVRWLVQGVWWLVNRSSSPLSSLPDLFSLNCLSRACRRASRSFSYS